MKYVTRHGRDIVVIWILYDFNDFLTPHFSPHRSTAHKRLNKAKAPEQDKLLFIQNLLSINFTYKTLYSQFWISFTRWDIFIYHLVDDKEFSSRHLGLLSSVLANLGFIFGFLGLSDCEKDVFFMMGCSC